MLDARAAAWLGSEHFDAAMVRAPCGCDLANRAERETDSEIAETMQSQVTQAREAWGCRFGRCEPVELGREQQLALAAIERMTGWQPPPTCPRASLSHSFLTDALRLGPALEHGTLPTLRDVPNVLIDAVYATAEGRGERQEYERKVRESRESK